MPSGTSEQKMDFNDPNQRFHITDELAQTLQGRIYAATDRKTGQFVVIKETWKQLVASGCSRDGTPVPEDFFEETRILSVLSTDPNRHPHFVHIICQWEEPLTYNYAMDGCKFGDLFDFVKNKHMKDLRQSRQEMFNKNMKLYKKNSLPNDTKDKWILSVKHMFRQLVDCLSWMHDRNICHLDMSLENTMVYSDSDCNVKIIDFGLARDLHKHGSNRFNKRVGKRGYMAPEVYGKQEYNCKLADVWSLGVMLYMMLIGAPPYELPLLTCVPFKYLVNGRLRDMLTHWKRLHYVTDDIIDLLVKIFTSERKRISLDDIKAHPFVNLIDDPLYPTANTTTKDTTEQKSNEAINKPDNVNKNNDAGMTTPNNLSPHGIAVPQNSQSSAISTSVDSTMNVTAGAGSPKINDSTTVQSEPIVASGKQQNNNNRNKNKNNKQQREEASESPNKTDSIIINSNSNVDNDNNNNNNSKKNRNKNNKNKNKNKDKKKNKNKNKNDDIETEDANEDRPHSPTCCIII